MRLIKPLLDELERVARLYQARLVLQQALLAELGKS